MEKGKKLKTKTGVGFVKNEVTMEDKGLKMSTTRLCICVVFVIACVQYNRPANVEGKSV